MYARRFLTFWVPVGLRPITICTGLKDRSENYVQVMLESLKKAENSELISLSVFDCGSSDVPDLKQKIKDVWDGNLVFSSEKMDFTRSRSFNAAVSQAETDLVFICDADIEIPANIVKLVCRNTSKRVSWFPILWWLNEDNATGSFFSGSTGMLSCYKSNFKAVGGYDESITSWGYEDWTLYFSFYRHRITAYRTKEKNMKHHWHKSLKPEGFKKMF
jgi:predicted glycosyltransferase involved in capsule biosynthesis